MRRTFNISGEDWEALNNARGSGVLRDPTRVRAIWARMGREMGFDPATVLSCQHLAQFTALPPDHGKHWCWPCPLRCRHRPPAYAGNPDF